MNQKVPFLRMKLTEREEEPIRYRFLLKGQPVVGIRFPAFPRRYQLVETDKGTFSVKEVFWHSQNSATVTLHNSTPENGGR